MKTEFIHQMINIPKPLIYLFTFLASLFLTLFLTFTLLNLFVDRFTLPDKQVLTLQSYHKIYTSLLTSYQNQNPKVTLPTHAQLQQEALSIYRNDELQKLYRKNLYTALTVALVISALLLYYLQTIITNYFQTKISMSPQRLQLGSISFQWIDLLEVKTQNRTLILAFKHHKKPIKLNFEEESELLDALFAIDHFRINNSNK
jgi:hypothetical protein